MGRLRRGFARARGLGEALSAYDRVIELWPNAAEALGNRAAALFGLGRFEEALAVSEAALAVARLHSVRPKPGELPAAIWPCTRSIGGMKRWPIATGQLRWTQKTRRRTARWGDPDRTRPHRRGRPGA